MRKPKIDAETFARLVLTAIKEAEKLSIAYEELRCSCASLMQVPVEDLDWSMEDVIAYTDLALYCNRLYGSCALLQPPRTSSTQSGHVGLSN